MRKGGVLHVLADHSLALGSVAAAFTDLIKSFVSGILMPPISIILPLNKNIEEKFAVLRAGDRSNSTTTQYSTVQQALDDGAVVMAYGCVPRCPPRVPFPK